MVELAGRLWIAGLLRTLTPPLPKGVSTELTLLAAEPLAVLLTAMSTVKTWPVETWEAVALMEEARTAAGLTTRTAVLTLARVRTWPVSGLRPSTVWVKVTLPVAVAE